MRNKAGAHHVYYAVAPLTSITAADTRTERRTLSVACKMGSRVASSRLIAKWKTAATEVSGGWGSLVRSAERGKLFFREHFRGERSVDDETTTGLEDGHPRRRRRWSLEEKLAAVEFHAP